MRRGCSSDALAISLAVCALACANACGGGSRSNGGAFGASAMTESPTDNARRSGYAGTTACVTCHAELVRTFVQSPMHNMTRALGASHPETVVQAPFAGSAATFLFHDDVAVASAQAGERFLDVTIANAAGSANPPAHHRYRLTKVLGGRVREDFVGVEEGVAGSEERVVPVTWLIGEQRWRYKGYSVMTPERSHLAPGAVWRTTCIGCHNTMTLLDAQASGIASEIVTAHGRPIASPLPWPDRLLPMKDRRALVTLDADRLGKWTKDADARVANFGEGDLVELGIGCEACHAGSRMHAVDPQHLPSFDPTGAPYKWTEPLSASNTDAKAVAVNRACSRCHQVLFSAYPWTWEGGMRSRAPATRIAAGAGGGGSTTTSGEARDFLLGSCAQKMDCTNCHDPHGGTGRAAEEAMATPAGNARCTSCHGKYADAAARKRHAHHDPNGAGGACIACHMAKKNMGLDGHLTRYHRIGSPTDSQRVLFDRPLECAICHPGATVRSLIETMETWFGRRYERAPLEALYGELDRPVLLSTLDRGKPHEKAVAAELLGQAKDRRALPGLMLEVNDPVREPYPIVRDYARAAIEAIDNTITLPPRDAPNHAGGHESAEPEED